MAAGVLVRRILVLAVLSGVGVAPALAQTQPAATGAWSIGARGGVSLDPKQAFGGVHLESPGLTSTGHLTFRPVVEVGVGSDATIIAGLLDVLYWARFPNSSWSLLFGAGPGVVHERQTFGDCPPGFDCEDTDSNGTFSGVVGLAHSGGFGLEFRTTSRGRGFSVAATYVIKR
jgi:hypothetical protein